MYASRLQYFLKVQVGHLYVLMSFGTHIYCYLVN